jgi:hypothetical protein
MLRKLNKNQCQIIHDSIDFALRRENDMPIVLMSNSEICITFKNEYWENGLTYEDALRKIAKVSKNEKVTEVKVNF